LFESAIALRSFLGIRLRGRELAERLGISRTTVVSAYGNWSPADCFVGKIGRDVVCAAPEPSGTPFAWRGKIASAAPR
jgi:hypothetical protein